MDYRCIINARSFSVTSNSTRLMSRSKGVRELTTLVPGNIDPGVRPVAHKTTALAPVVAFGHIVTLRHRRPEL